MSTDPFRSRPRNSRSRDRWRRRSPDSQRSPDRQRQPFSVFPQAEENRSHTPFRLTPNASSLRHDQEQDLHTWRNLDHRDREIDLPPIVRRPQRDPPSTSPPPISFISHPDGRFQYNMHSTSRGSEFFPQCHASCIQSTPTHSSYDTTDQLTILPNIQTTNP